MPSRTSATPPTALFATAEGLGSQPHEAFYAYGEPMESEDDTGLRCWCGTEVVSVLDDPDGEFPTGWAHVGVS